MRNPSEIDDLQLEQPDDSWVAGEMNLTEERPDTALRSDTSQRKWMLIGLGGCALVMAIATIALTHDAGKDQLAEQPAVEPVATEQPVEAAPVEPAPVEPTPAVVEQPKPREKPTLAATSRAAAPPAINKAPPTPAAAPSEKPAAPAAAKPSTPAPAPAPTPASKPTPAPTPALPADEPSTDGPARELPDVEAWDDADAAVEQDQEPVEASPSAS